MKIGSLCATLLAVGLGMCDRDEPRTIIFNGHSFAASAKAACEFSARNSNPMDQDVRTACKSFDVETAIYEFRRVIEASFVTTKACAGMRLTGHAPPNAWGPEISRLREGRYWELRVDYVPGTSSKQSWVLYRHDSKAKSDKQIIRTESTPEKMIELVCLAASEKAGTLLDWSK